MKLKKFVCTTIRLYKVLLLTCMINCTTGMPMPQLFPVVQWSVHWAPSQTTWLLVLARARCCALKTCRKNKMPAPLLGLAKSIYYSVNVHRNFFITQTNCRTLSQKDLFPGELSCKLEKTKSNQTYLKKYFIL